MKTEVKYSRKLIDRFNLEPSPLRSVSTDRAGKTGIDSVHDSQDLPLFQVTTYYHHAVKNNKPSGFLNSGRSSELLGKGIFSPF